MRCFSLSRYFYLPVVRGFPSEAEFEEYILFDYTSKKVLAAIVFDCGFKNKNDPLPLQVRKFYFSYKGFQVSCALIIVSSCLRYFNKLIIISPILQMKKV